MSDYEATAYLSLEKLKVSGSNFVGLPNRAISLVIHITLLLIFTGFRRNTCLSSSSFRIKYAGSCALG